MTKKLCERALLTFVVFIILCLFTPSFVFAEQIDNFNATIVINKDGTISVSEKIVYDFGSLQKHGIYRDIPIIKTNQEGKQFKLDFRIQSVSDELGKAYNYSTSYQGDNLQLKIGDADRTITGVHTYIISYNVSGALTYFSDHDELYWNITGNDWNIALDKVSSTISLPQLLQTSEIQMACFTGFSGSREKNCQYQTDGKKALFTSNTILNPGQGMTIVVGFPKNMVAVLEPKEVVPFFNTSFGKIILAVLIMIALIWYLLYPIWLIIKWYKYGRDPKIYQPVSAWFDPPKNKQGDFLTPGETGALYDERVDMEDMTATIIHLAQKGYLQIEERKKKKLIGSKSAYYLVKTGGENYSSLLSFERELLEGIFSTKDEVELKQDENLYKAVIDAKKKLYEQLVTGELFPKNPNSIRNFYTGIMVASAVTLNPLLFISSLIFGRSMSRRTLFGAEQLGVARSLRNFLSSQERQLKFQADKQLMFEKLLPYAVAFSVEKIWAERFKDMDLEPPEWFSSYQPGTFNSILFANALSSSMSSFASAATPIRSSSGFSSGFGGGGFSGGGGGGGSW